MIHIQQQGMKAIDMIPSMNDFWHGWLLAGGTTVLCILASWILCRCCGDEQGQLRVEAPHEGRQTHDNDRWAVHHAAGEKGRGLHSIRQSTTVAGWHRDMQQFTEWKTINGIFISIHIRKNKSKSTDFAISSKYEMLKCGCQTREGASDCLVRLRKGVAAACLPYHAAFLSCKIGIIIVIM